MTKLGGAPWEFDKRRAAIAEDILLPLEELTWQSTKENEFGGETVYKTLRKTSSGDITFMVENYERTKVLTVGTYDPS